MSNMYGPYDLYDFARDVSVALENDGSITIHSNHEAYGLLKEHLDRFWGEVLLRDSSIHRHTMAVEITSIAALCFKIMVDLKLRKNGREK